MKLPVDNLRDWIGSDHLTVDNLLTMLADALNDEDEAFFMLADCKEYAKQCEEEE